jgi:Na+-transporting NADH:ubiquinone oxidoreductase subunit D
MTCGTGPCGGRGFLTLKEGIWANNPLAIQVLGICSALAVTNRLENSLVMGAALIFVGVGSNLFVSLLRKYTPHRIRMIAEVAIIATFVILFDQFLKAFYWDMSKQLGPYVGLIITNCIIMGRAEAFALQNPPLLSIIDGLANGLGYAAILAIIGLSRELLGTGKIFGYTILNEQWYTSNQLMILAPGAFFALGIVIAIFNALKGPDVQEINK